MEYKVNHIPKGRIRPGTKLNAQYITIHSTGNPTSTAMNERNWLVNPSNTRVASWHIAVDEKMAVEAIPLDEVAYHAGTSAGNNTSIGIEICESGDRRKTLANAAKTAAKVLHERGWGVDKMYRHYDWSGKICPRILSNNNWEGWNKFKMEVQKELDKLKTASKASNDKPSPWAKDAWEWAIKNGITDGSRPKDNATREEIITMIYRALKVK